MKLQLRVTRKAVAGFSWLQVVHAPIDAEGGHTSYLLLAGERDGEVMTFPESNYQLTTPEHRREIADLLAADGLAITEGET